MTAAQARKPRHLLSQVRDYFRMLVASTVVLSVSLIGYLYWFDHSRHELEEVANRYHLETILYCIQIQDALNQVSRPQNHSPFNAEHLDEWSELQNAYGNALYVIEQHTHAIGQQHETYGVVSKHAPLIEPVLRKAARQLAEAKTALEKTGSITTGPSMPSATSLLGNFFHSVEQLRRFHLSAKDEIDSELQALKTIGSARLIAFMGAAFLLGSLVVWRILRQIRSLIDKQQKTETILRQSAAVFENASEGVLITDADGKILGVNKAFTKITGYSEDEVLGRDPSLLKSGRHDRSFYADMWSSLQQCGEWQGEISDRRKNGEIFPKWQTISEVRDHNGRLTNYVSLFSDISHIKESEAKLHHLAHHDSLTGLPNRLLLDARLEHSLQHANRDQTNVAVMFLDLDHFKKINDSLGHPVGDKLLQLVAARLQDTVRNDDTVARLGGDELTIVLGSLKGPNCAATAAQNILDSMSKPFPLKGQDVFVSASIGVSIYPRDGSDATALLKNADTAMYKAKKEGRNRYDFYSKELTERARESLTLDTHMHRAVEREEFFLQFQPQVSLKSGRIVGVEALVRWQHPEIGLVSPDKFIPLAEENGLIAAIGTWVLRTACKQAMTWQNAGLMPVRMSVNLSGKQLAQPHIVQDVRDALNDTGLEPRYLELELTESSVMIQAERAAKTLDALRALGVTIAIDDFGTGYSSLSYLKRFPVDRLKIDRSFVRDLPQDTNDVALAKAIVALAGSLDLNVVAEGVETEAQKRLLTSIGCDEMQGFLFSAPRDAREVVGLLGTATRSICVND